ncbi:MAG: glutathione synthase [Rickettsiaceae bacterium H1]|nr:glutathione synthase [Rickettsiaceae bacterium H1]
MKLNIAVQIDSVIDFQKDSTFLLMQEAQRRGYKLYHYTSEQLILKSCSPYALATEVETASNGFVFGTQNLIKLDDIDIVLMRQNPPFDMRYITTTYILEKCKKAVILNNPTGVRNFPEKMSAESSLPTLITENLDLIEEFHKIHKEVVLKPLYAYGGQNVSYIKGDSNNVKIIANLIKDTYSCSIIAQKFHPRILEGDKRVTMLNGKMLDVFSRIPEKDEFRTNLCLRNKCVKSSLTVEEKNLCEDIGEKLIKNGILLAGIDLIGNHIIEVNVTSPTGLTEINALYRKNVERDCWNVFESMYARVRST